jgi:hypothetical protein
MHADASACKLKAVAWLQTLQNDVLKSVKELDDLMKIYHKEQVPCYPRLPSPPPTLALALSRSTRRGTRKFANGAFGIGSVLTRGAACATLTHPFSVSFFYV